MQYIVTKQEIEQWRGTLAECVKYLVNTAPDRTVADLFGKDGYKIARSV